MIAMDKSKANQSWFGFILSYNVIRVVIKVFARHRWIVYYVYN